jgi:type II secretory pathway pseudopilin PulG
MTKDNGVTLISLIVTIIVLMIILSITINYGVSTIYEVSNDKMESELSLVQEAIMQQYALVKSKNELGLVATSISSNKSLSSDSGRPTDLVGTRIADVTTITNKGFSTPINNYSSNATNLTYEQYYYSLNKNDLKSIGIEKQDNSSSNSTKEIKYIVNYSTGEVFDIGNGKYYQTNYQTDDLIYLQGTNSKIESTIYDFNDN